jgi:hypothetical protein
MKNQNNCAGTGVANLEFPVAILSARPVPESSPHLFLNTLAC